MDDIKHLLYVAKTISYRIGEKLELSWRVGGGYNLVNSNRFSSQIEEEISNDSVKLIESSFPEHNIITPFHDIKKGSVYTWYVDPIDGSKYYIRQIPLFGTSVAITESSDPIVGVVRNPISKQTYWGYKGLDKIFLNSKVITPKKDESLKSLIIATEIGNLDKLSIEDKIETYNLRSKLNEYVYRVRGYGCTSLTMAWLVSGGLDAYVNLTGHYNPISIYAGLGLLSSGNFFYKKYPYKNREIFIAARNEKTATDLIDIIRN